MSKYTGRNLSLLLRDGLFWLAVTLVLAVGVWLAAAVNAHSANIQRGLDATVQVLSSDGRGTGVHIGNGVVVTASHVIRPDGRFVVKDRYGGEHAVAAYERIGNDIALLLVPTLQTDSVAMRCDADGEPGEVAYHVGYPNVAAEQVYRGYVASVVYVFSREALHPDTVIEFQVIDVFVGPGSSGGPVFDNDDNLIGIVVLLLGDDISPSGAMVPVSVICGYAYPSS